jgi:hypothetical protein
LTFNLLKLFVTFHVGHVIYYIGRVTILISVSCFENVVQIVISLVDKHRCVMVLSNEYKNRLMPKEQDILEISYYKYEMKPRDT